MSVEKEIESTPSSHLSRRRFLQVASAGAGAVAISPALIGCGTDSGSSSSSTTTGTTSSWSFGIMADTQWTTGSDADGLNPYTCAAEQIRQLNNQFIDSNVPFVIHVGDLCDGVSEPSSAANGELIRAAYTQALFNNNIGFFPLRGNHDDQAEAGTTVANLASQFVSNYPQTQNGVMNNTPSAALSVTNPDATTQPIPAKTGTTFTVGSNFSSPDPWGTGDLKGLSYSFDVNGSRFILLDQFAPTDYSSNSNYSIDTTIAAQQSWITTQLKSRPTGGHAFVFGHKGLITQDHVDVLLGENPAQNPTNTDAFIQSLAGNGVHVYINGHDHMHDRSIVYTTDGKTASVMQQTCASDSSKFYTPATTANDVTYNVAAFGVKRQVPIRQELYKIGYYLVTIEGNNATIEYWAADVNVSSGVASTIPALNFTLRETYGYSLVGQQFQIQPGSSFTTVSDKSPNGTTAKILAGTNLSITTDLSSRALVRVVNTGWGTVSGLASDVLYLWGIQSALSSEQSETYVLQLSYNSLSSTSIASGNAGIATLDDAGNWTNAVSNNYGGTKKFVQGAWQSSYALGTYGVDTANNVAWAVVNYGGKFAVSGNI